MKVIAINGSPKAEGNTYHALRVIGNQLAESGIELEIMHVGNKPIHGCTGCGQCFKHKDERCHMKDDGVNDAIQKMKEADGIIIASPVFYAGIAGTMKCFLDRAFYGSPSCRIWAGDRLFVISAFWTPSAIKSNHQQPCQSL